MHSMCSTILPRVAPNMTSPSQSPKSNGGGKKKEKTDRDDWCNITESAERRRAQNRVSQRNHRQRIRNKIAHLEATIARAGDRPQSPFAAGYPNVQPLGTQPPRRASASDAFFYGQVPSVDKANGSYHSSSPDIDLSGSSFRGTEASFDTSFSPPTSMDQTPSPVPCNTVTESTSYTQSPMSTNLTAFNGVDIQTQPNLANMNPADFPLWDYDEELSVGNLMASPEHTTGSMEASIFAGTGLATAEEQEIYADQQRSWVVNQPRPVYPSRALSEGFAHAWHWNQGKAARRAHHQQSTQRPIQQDLSDSTGTGHLTHSLVSTLPLEINQADTSNCSHYHLQSKQTGNGPDSSRAYVTMVMLTEDGRCPGCSCSHTSANPGLTIRVPIDDLKHFPIEPQI